MNTHITPGKRMYVGLFMLTLSTLMYEVLLTRIFSVTMWYHFAFMAISIAVFGMSAGAIAVYFFSWFFKPERSRKHLSVFSFLFSISLLISFSILLNLPSVKQEALFTLRPLTLTYITASVPFFFSGLCICLALTKFPRIVGKLYAADLIGSAVGCILLIQLLNITGAPTALVIVALFACMGSLFFASEAGIFKMKLVALLGSVACASLVLWHCYLLAMGTPVLRLKWAKGKREPETYLYERWNSFSRITVSGNPYALRHPFGWGLSDANPSTLRVKELKLEIDGAAGTILTGFDGNVQELNYLKDDITNLVHYVRPNSDVLVIGTGGGRDILSALAFKQRSVTGVEMNDEIVATVNKKFGDFTGHLDHKPNVAFVTDEARSWLTRQPSKFDIIQLSLIDTWAATSAGAFVLAENSLYTQEAWKIFIDHLSPNGVLTVSRWYSQRLPGEIYRLTSLAAASLEEAGIKNPRNHIVIARHMIDGKGESPDGVGTLLLSRRPFSRNDLIQIQNVVDELGFEVVLTPKYAIEPIFNTLASGKQDSRLAKEFPLDISPPTDDRPFFFNMLRMHDVLHPFFLKRGTVTFNIEAVYVLAKLLFIVIVLMLLFFILPLIIRSKRTSLNGSFPLFIYFAGIGFGFMMIEISQMQRLIVFLGHPTYGLSVVLFSLLLSSGIGSYLTSRMGGSNRIFMKSLIVLLAALAVYGLGASHVIEAMESKVTPVRILATAGILFPVGIFMGMAFPIGMDIASTRWKELTPWFWAINGTTSVTASVVAIAISMSWSIQAAFWTGFACYCFAFLAFAWLNKENLLSWVQKRLQYDA